MAKPATRPIKVTARLLDGRVNSPDGIIMLDGVLYHAWFARHYPAALEGLGSAEYSGYFGLPLRQLPGNRYAASRAVYSQGDAIIEYTNKRPNFFAADKFDKLDMDNGIISDGVGLYRAYRTPQLIRLAEGAVLTFYAMGHADEVADLLTEMSAIGKKAAIGYGFVAEWNVEETDEDYSLWHPTHGLMRPVEAGNEEAAGLLARGLPLEDYPVMQYGVRPPYWKPANGKLCHVPVTK